MIKDDGSIAVSIRTRTSKFSASQTASFAHTLVKTMSESIKSHPQTTIGDLDIFTRRDYQQVMNWNRRLPDAVDSCFHQLFEEVARKTPDASSICSRDRSFTYRELDEVSTKLANYLVGLGVGPESLVLICFHKSSIAIVSMLAIFKAGGAFVAMDPSYPASRIQAIATATKTSIVVAEPAHSHLFEGIVEHMVSLDHNSIDELPVALGKGGVRVQPCPSNTAYVVFTSGSTGAPKGIMVEHRALSTAALSLAAPMRVTAKSRFLQFAAYTFDLSYGDIFVTLSQGGCICIPSEHERVNGLAAAMVRMNVNTACLIPSVARIFQPEDVPCLKTLLVGGEALLQEVLDLWATKVDLVQMYGPSEATIWCTAQPLLRPGSAASNIGRGLAALLWITSVTSHERLCPIGCIGELLIEGPVLARGYLDAQQTELSFVENPSWAEVGPGQRRRFYKTGDLVRCDADGTVRFVGRKDTQIKFHGRRIELGEIEYHLSSHDLLRQSMVTLPSKGVYSRHLVAIVVLKSSSKPSGSGVGQLKLITGISKEKAASEIAKVKDFLSVKVPSYMLPQYWVAVEEIPSMISGKMNRVMAKSFVESLTERSAKEIVRSSRGNTNREFHDTVEIRLRDIWARILDKEIKDISIDSNFFDLGGDSFSAMELVASCKSEGLVLTVQDILSTTTIRQMASNIKLSTQQHHDIQDHSALYKVLKFAPSWWDPGCTPVATELGV
jgi:amino acid adenylation domain-containing protein